MNRDKVIEVLEDIKRIHYKPAGMALPQEYTERTEALTQAISMIKENGELRKELRDTREASWEIQRQDRELQQELTDLKKAVASEGLGVEYVSDIIYATTQYLNLPDKEVAILNNRLKTAIHEAQTKYKKEKGE